MYLIKLMINSLLILCNFIILLVVLFLLPFVTSDFTLVCNPGYHVSSIRRVNSPHQRDKLGSLAIDCQPILATTGNAKSNVKCEALENTPACNGWAEGCHENQWLGGFNAYMIDNGTGAILLDPICCQSPEIKIDQISCASERLNFAKRPFEHTITTEDFVYRGLHCWHQYDTAGVAVDLVWKMEICQFANAKRKSVPGGGGTVIMDFARRKLYGFVVGNNCPPCSCHCGPDVCSNGNEPIRVTHKLIGSTKYQKCTCDCVCRYECV